MKDIENFEGRYAVTSCGKVWSYKSKKFLKPQMNENGYLRVELYGEDGSRKKYFIHRLVAEAYLPNPNNLPEVNHIREFEKTNNCLNNLCWITIAENNDYGTRTQRAAAKLKKPIYCKELDKVFSSATDAAKELGLCRQSISKCCKGERNHTGGYHFEFVEVSNDVG